MNRWIALAALALAGCAGASEVQDGRWLTPAELGYAEQAQWGMALPADFTVDTLPAAEVDSICGAENGAPPAGAHYDGCAPRGEHRIVLREDVASELLHQDLLHEMGHLLRGRPGHLDSAGMPEESAALCGTATAPGTLAVMCTYGSAPGTALSAADFEFVLGR